MVRMLLKQSGQGIEQYRLSDGGNLLHLAAASGPASLIKELVNAGINANLQTSQTGVTPLHIASSHGRLSAVEALLHAKDIDDTLCDNKERVARDVAKTKTIEAALSYAQNKYVEQKHREMHAAIAKGDIKTLLNIFSTNRAKKLLDPNALNSHGETILHFAARTGKAELVKACLELGANPFAKNRRGKMPIEVSTVEEVRSLLKDGRRF